MNKKSCFFLSISLMLVIYSGECLSQTTEPLERTLEKWQDYNDLAICEVMVLGTFHFDEDILDPDSQRALLKLIEALERYQPSKILLEWEPARFESTNRQYHDYIADSFSIDSLSNEVYQLGFRMAKQLSHEKVYLFDDQTEYIGSLEQFASENDPFSFDLFTEYARKEDQDFFDQHEDPLIDIYHANQQLMAGLDIHQHIALLNSPVVQEVNAQRMHMYEVRVGIQKNWSGPDWLGRWYRRNVRMMANALKLAEEGDKLLIIVGDNHKWTLDMLFSHTPDFQLVSSWDYLKGL